MPACSSCACETASDELVSEHRVSPPARSRSSAGATVGVGRQRPHRGNDLVRLRVAQLRARALGDLPQRAVLRGREIDVAAGDHADERELEHLGEPLRTQGRVAERALEQRVERGEVEQGLVDVEGQDPGHWRIGNAGRRRRMTLPRHRRDRVPRRPRHAGAGRARRRRPRDLPQPRAAEAPQRRSRSGRSPADVLDFDAMRRAMKGCDVLFHTSGFVGSTPAELVWRLNAHAPGGRGRGGRRGGPEARRADLDDLGDRPADGRPANEETRVPERRASGSPIPTPSTTASSPRSRPASATGSRSSSSTPPTCSACPSTPTSRARPRRGWSATTCAAACPRVIDAPMNFADVEDVATGHLLAAERGKPGERYILGGDNRLGRADRHGRARLRHPPPGARAAARDRPRRPLPRAPRAAGRVPAEGFGLMAKDWRFSSEKAKRELGYARARSTRRSARPSSGTST